MFERREKSERRGAAFEYTAGAGLGAALIGALAGLSVFENGRNRSDSPNTPAAVADAEPSLDRKELREIAKEAYLWGWPLVYVHQIRVALGRVPFPAIIGGVPVAPINRLSMLTNLINPGAAAVPCANQDVIYGFGMFDLQVEPVVLQVPDFGKRFWLYQLGDQRTDAFAEVGCMYGTTPGCYLVVGPEWDHPIPDGIKGIFRCPTRYGYCLPRVYFENSESDRAAALPAVNQIMAYPLSEFTASMQTRDWSKPRWIPNIANHGSRTRNVSPDTFFDALPKVLEEVPPLPGEEAMYARFKRLVRDARRDPLLAKELGAVASEIDKEVIAPLFQFRNVGDKLPGNWTTVRNGGAFGSDYTTRTAVAKSNVFVNRHAETKYFYLDLDAQGTRLQGSGEYEITFNSSALPPAKGFWSLTVYDDKHILPEGTGGRVSLGSRDRSLVFNPDGSLTISIGHDGGAKGLGSNIKGSPTKNRLSAPAGDFSLYLRIYWPERGALDGTWTPPAAERRGAPSQ
jgi:hypothetical protein